MSTSPSSAGQSPDTPEPRPRHAHPRHDVRALRDRLLSALKDLDALDEILRDPADAPELSDYQAPVTWQGRPYRVVGSATRPGTEQIDIFIEPRSADHG